MILIMMIVELSERNIKDINEALSSAETKPRFSRRLLAIKMAGNGIKRDDICSTLEITRATLSSYVKDYINGGLAAVLEDRSYKPASSVDVHLKDIEKQFKETPPSTAKEAAFMIERICGVRLRVTQARLVMAKKLGMGFRKSGTLPGKVDPQIQMDFLTEELEPRLLEAENEQREVYFVDASHFLWGGYADYCWCFERQWIKSSSGRKRFNVLGAVNAVSKHMICCETEGSVNALTVCSLLIDINNAHKEGAISVILDNVPYQHAKIVREMAVLLGIELVFLPPYSPNLNLIERAWKFVKKEALSNKYYETFESFKMGIVSCIQRMNSDMKNEMNSLLSLKFQMFNL